MPRIGVQAENGAVKLAVRSCGTDTMMILTKVEAEYLRDELNKVLPARPKMTAQELMRRIAPRHANLRLVR